MGDLGRLYEFLRPVNQPGAARVVQRLTDAPGLLKTQPIIGTKRSEFEPRELRYILVGDHEMRYEIVEDGDIWIWRLWQAREFP